MKELAFLVRAARPRTLIMGIVPVCVGSLLAFEQAAFSWNIFFAAVCFALSIQITTNFANDYFDFVKGADTPQRLGPERMLQAGHLSKHQMQRSIALMLGASVIIGCYLVYLSGPVMLLIAVSSVLLSILYTGGPWPLAYWGLGDVFVLLYFGVIATGATFYLHANYFSVASILVGLGIGCVSTAVLVINNLRDVSGDALAKKRTLAVLLGERFSATQYLLLLGIAPIFPLILAERKEDLVMLLFYLPAFRLATTFLNRSKPRDLNPIMGETVMLVGIYGCCFAISKLLVWF